MKKGERLDWVLLLIHPVIASIIAYVLELEPLPIFVLFTLVPAIYLSTRNRFIVPKSLVFAFVTGLPLTLFLFNAGLKPAIDAAIIALCGMYFVIVFYEMMLDADVARHDHHPNMHYVLFIAILVLWGTFAALMRFLPSIAIVILVLALFSLAIYHRRTLGAKVLKCIVYGFFMAALLTDALGAFRVQGLGVGQIIPYLVAVFLFALAGLAWFDFFDAQHLNTLSARRKLKR